MYGYFQPSSANLTSEEKRVFKSYYCRLCYCLWAGGGQLSRWLTSFDVTIYSIVFNLARGGERPPIVKCEKIRRNNLRRFSIDEDGKKLASLIFIALGEKTQDDILDENSFKAKVIQRIFKKQIEGAKQTDAAMARIAEKSMRDINEKQVVNEGLDDLLNVYGEMLADLFAEFAVFDTKYRNVFFYLGKWSFFIDMLFDYGEDYKEGKYNFFKTEGLPTFKKYFNTHYAYVVQKNREISEDLMQAIYALDDGSKEYHILEKVVGHAVRQVIPDLMEGKKSKYNYFCSGVHRIKKSLKRKTDSNFDSRREYEEN